MYAYKLDTFHSSNEFYANPLIATKYRVGQYVVRYLSNAITAFMGFPQKSNNISFIYIVCIIQHFYWLLFPKKMQGIKCLCLADLFAVTNMMCCMFSNLSLFAAWQRTNCFCKPHGMLTFYLMKFTHKKQNVDLSNLDV